MVIALISLSPGIFIIFILHFKLLDNFGWAYFINWSLLCFLLALFAFSLALSLFFATFSFLFFSLLSALGFLFLFFIAVLTTFARVFGLFPVVVLFNFVRRLAIVLLFELLDPVLTLADLAVNYVFLFVKLDVFFHCLLCGIIRRLSLFSVPSTLFCFFFLYLYRV